MTEPTRVTVGGPTPHVNDRLTDLYDRFRPGFLVLAIPVIAIAGAVAFLGSDSGTQPAVEEEAVAGTTTQVVVTSEQPAAPAEEPEVQVLAAAASEPAFSEPIPAEGFTKEPPPPPPAPAKKATTSTTAAPTTAAPTTTAAPSTQPPPPTDPPDLCKVRIGGSTPLKAEPRGKSDTVGEVLAGSYPALGAKRNWIQVNVGGTQGWIRAREVTEVTGNC